MSQKGWQERKALLTNGYLYSMEEEGVPMRYAVMGATVEQVKSAGGANIKEARSTGIIFATLTEEQVSRLKSQGCTVGKVGEVKTAVKAPIAPPAPVAAVPIYTPEQLVQITGLEDVRNIFRPPPYGEGFNLAIVGTGIRETHEKISGHVVYSKNYTSDPMEDGFDHDTSVCSIALAVAPKCNILNLKVLDDKGEGTEEEVVLAIDDIISMHDTGAEFAPHAINLSLGSPDDGNPNNILRIACRAALEKNIWIIAAAGNSGPAPGTVMTPACEKYVAAVGSAKYLPDQKTFVVSDFSSRGPTLEGLIKPDALLFGEDIEMASSSSDTATIAKSGTSFATPFASAMILLFLEIVYRQALPTEEVTGIYPGQGPGYFTPADIIDKYLPGLSIKPQGISAGKDNDYGCGLPFGPLVLRVLQVKPALDLSAMLTGMIAIMMIGMMLKTIK
jgi:serine protease AprX